MKIKITRNTVADKKIVKIGDVLDLPAGEANFLINIKKAVIYVEEKKEEPKKAPVKKEEKKEGEK